MIKLVVVKNPFQPRENRLIKSYEFGVTVKDVLAEVDLGDTELNCYINGETIECNADYVIPDNEIVVVSPVVAKGRAGKILGMVAGIALMVYGGAVAAAGSNAMLGTTNAVAHAWIGATMGIAGSMLVSVSQSMYAKSIGNPSYENEDATYSWSGVQTMEGQMNPVPMTYGKVKSGGQTIGKYVSVIDNKEYLNWLISAGEGVLELTDIMINDNPIANYEGVEVDVRNGTNEQEIISNFNDTYFTKNLGYQLLENERIDTVEGNATQGIIVKVEFPNGLYYANDKGGLDNAWVTVNFAYKIKGTDNWNNLTDGDVKIEGSQSSALRKEYRIDNLPQGEYEVRAKVVSRSHDVNSSRASVRCFWNSLTSIVYDDFTYPNIALIGIKALATDQLNGSPNLSFMKERPYVWVFNPNSGAYEQRPSNNPAWASYDMLHLASKLRNINTNQDEFEIRGVPAKNILYEQFEEWAEFCDEKNLKVNIEITQCGEMLETINGQIANCGRGSVLRFGTRYGAIWNCVKQPVQMFGMGNIISGTFNEEFLKISDRANCVEVTYNDADMNYTRNAITIYSDSYDNDVEQKTAQTTYNGITSYEQAYREGLYQLYCNQYQLRTVSFDANVDSIACTVGDVVLVSHDVPRWAYSGRIVDVDVKNNAIILPVDVEIEAGKYRIMFRTEQDNLYTIPIERIERVKDYDNNLEYSKVFLESALTENDLPQSNDIFDIALATIGSKPFVVKSISRSQDFTRRLECIEYSEDIFNENYTVPPIDYSLPDIKVENVENVSVRQTKSVAENGEAEYKLELSWEYDKNAVFDIFVSYDDVNYNLLISGVKTRSYSTALQSKISKVKIVTRNSVKVSSGYIADVETIDEILPPNTPNNVNIYIDDMFNVKWDKVTNADVDYYEVRKNNNVGEENGLIAKVTSNVCSTNLVTERSGDIYVFAIGLSGKHNAPAIKSYNFATPIAPSFTAEVGVKSVTLSCNNKPSNCYAIQYNLVGASHSYEIKTDESIKVIGVEADVYSVVAKFLDYFGAGATYNKTVTVKAFIDPIWIANESIVEDKLDRVLQNTLSTFQSDIAGLKSDLGELNGLSELQGKVDEINRLVNDLGNQDFSSYLSKTEANGYINTTLANWGLIDSQKKNVNVYTKTETANQISSTLVNYVTTSSLNSRLNSYSTITQLNDAIGLCVANTDYNGNTIMSKINLGNGTVKIDGKYIHVTGDTVFDENVIIKGQMQAGSIDCDAGVSIKGGAVTVTGAGLQVANSNGSSVRFDSNGMSFVDSNGKTFSNIGRFAVGQVAHNQTINLGWDVAPKGIFLMPYDLQTVVAGYSASNVYIKCFADNITANGFTAKVYTTISNGSYAQSVFSPVSKTESINNTWGDRESTYSRIGTINTPITNLTVPSGASSSNLNIIIRLSDFKNYYHAEVGESGSDMDIECGYKQIYLDIYKNSSIVQTVTIAEVSKGYNFAPNNEFYANVSLNELAGGNTVGVRVRVNAVGYFDVNGNMNPTVKIVSGVATFNVVGDTVVSTGTATYFAIG